MIEELKQRMLAKIANVGRYEQTIEQFRQNRIFDFDQKEMPAKFNRGGVRPNDEKNKKILGDIWSIGKGHNLEAEWLKDIKNEK